MNISMVTVTVYFVGIAAFVNTPPHNSVTKSVIFPAADGGTYVTSTTAVNLMPHQTYLHIRGKDMASDTSPKTVCDRIGGSWVSAASAANDFCSVSLKGAKVWTLTSDELTEDTYFRKIPSFSQYCKSAKDLPA